MYSTSDKYKELIYSGKKCLLNVYIDGNLINDDDIYSFKVTHNLFDGGKVSLGSTTSKSIELEINREALPETYSNFYIETGLTIDGIDEIVPIGYFTLEEINKDEDAVSITAVDYMMKFEKIISDFVSSKAIEILQAICDVCGVELATTDFVGSDTELIIYDGTTMTARQVIGYIAELAGGFATIGRDGKLYIKKIGENTTTIDIDLFSEYSWGEKFVCNGVEFTTESYSFKASNEEITGQLLSLNVNNPFITTEEQVQAIYNNVIGLKINGFTGQSLLDPALDIGDIVYINEKPVVFQGDMEYLGYFKGNISSTIETEEKSKTTVQTINLQAKLNKVSNQVNNLEDEVENKVDSDEIISSINKSDEKVQIQAEKISLFGKEIDLTGDNITIKSNNFYVDENGKLSCSDAEMSGNIKAVYFACALPMANGGFDETKIYASLDRYGLYLMNPEEDENSLGITILNAINSTRTYLECDKISFYSEYDAYKNAIINGIPSESNPRIYIDETLQVAKSLIIPKNGTQGYGLCNSSGVSIIRDFGDANENNVTVDATGGKLYLGYENTTGLNFLSGAMTMTSSQFTSKNIQCNGWLVVSGTLRPNSNNSYTLGNSSNYWSNGYITKLYFNELVEKDMNVAVVSGDSTNSYFGTGGGSSGKTTNLRGNTVRLYAHSGGGVYLGNSGSTAVTSDENLKHIYDIDDKYIDFFNNLKPVTYKYKSNGHRKHFGFGARQVEKSLIDAGLTTEDFAGVLIDKDVTIGADENGTGEDIHYNELYSLRYEEFIALNTMMIQKAFEEINKIKNKIGG